LENRQDNNFRTLPEIYLSSRYAVSVVSEFGGFVHRLADVRRFGGELSRKDLQYLENLTSDLRKKLMDKGLIEGKEEERIPTIAKLIEQYSKTRVDVKERTLLFDKRHYGYLTEYFGDNKRVDLITAVEASGIKNYLMNERSAGRKNLQLPTANRAIKAFKTIFRFAVDSGYLTVSPFVKVKAGAVVNPDRKEFIDVERVREVESQCVGLHIELLSILMFGRFAGLRVPCEIQELRFSDFDFETNIFTVPQSGKTGKRRVPIFDELKPYVEKLRTVNSEYLFAKYRHCGNVGEMIKKSMRKAGLPLWRCFFNSLRSTRITECERMGWSRSLLDAVFGNSETIRQEHYIQPLPDCDYGKLSSAFSAASEPAVAENVLSVKHSPEISPEFGRSTGLWSMFQDLIKRRVNYSDICNMILDERGIDREQYKIFVNANPVIGKFAHLVNSLLLPTYDETSVKVSFRSVFFDVLKLSIKIPYLLWQFYKNFTVPKELAKESTTPGGT
jgi:integrase